MSGLEHIQDTFADLRAKKSPALMPYFTLGFPDPWTSLDVIAALAQSGADLIELGVPFSDPLADGPTIQRSTQVALEQGMTVNHCLEMTSQVRGRGVRQPLLLMGYFNPILARGIRRYVQDAADAGADGLIVPDLPMEEADELEAACQACGLALVYLVSPASTTGRINALARRTSGFLYLVSLTGVTGAREALPPELPDFVQRVRAAARTPLAVGFGISTPQQARAVAALADGVIIGSALIQAASRSEDPSGAASEFLMEIRAVLQPGAISPLK